MPSDGRVVQAKFRWDPSLGIATDYDLACDIEGAIGILPVGDNKGIVIGEEPSPTTLITQTDTVFILVVYRGEEDQAIEDFTRLADDFTFYDNVSYPAGEALYLFDSAYGGADEKDALQANLSHKITSVSLCEIERDELHYLVIKLSH